MTEPLVTVVITPREGHFLSEKSLLSVLADDCIPFELIYVDIASPPVVEQSIRAQAETRSFKILRHDDWVAPAVARKAAIAEVKTKYVVCADNDIFVDRGCLQSLVTCAEETGAGLVCPLYVELGGGREPAIHMAGGLFTWSEEPNARLVAEAHHLAREPMASAASLTRMKVDYTEFHYVLGRMGLLGRPGAISDDVLLVHEHIDLALFAREQGMDVMLEPAAIVRYVAFEPRILRDMAFFRQRWDVEACHRSLFAFARRWLTDGDEPMVDAMLGYGKLRLQEMELRRVGSCGADLAAPMARSELAQTRCMLREQALERGYDEMEMLLLDKACDFATLLFDGLYRPDGRPFLCHAIGTASALIRYELGSEIVQAGLLHAAFTHRPQWMPETELAEELEHVKGVIELVRGQPAAKAFLDKEQANLMALNMTGAGVVAILAANEADMRLSGEYRATGRPPEQSPVALDRIAEVLGHFGIDGLARSSQSAPGESPLWPLFGAGVRQASFRLDASNRRLLPI